VPTHQQQQQKVTIRIQRKYLFCFRVNTLTLFAVSLVDLASLRCFSAAVATVKTTATIVVVIVADAVAFVLRRTALSFTIAGGRFVIGILALALFTVGFLNVCTAAVAAVVITAAVVVFIVAVAVGLVLAIATGSFAVRVGFGFVFGIDALAHFAVIFLDRSASDSLFTAVAAVITTATDVVGIVAVAIALVIGVRTLTRTVRVSSTLVLGICALALFAVCFLDRSAN